MALLTYTRSLRFEEKPDYARIKQLLKDMFVAQGYQYDCAFDWVELMLKSQVPVKRHCSMKTESHYV